MASDGQYPTPIHGTPKFDDFTEIDDPVDFERLRGDSPLFSDKGEGRFFFQRDGVSYHFVDRWSGLTSYAEIQALAELGLYGENVCQSLQNTFNTANNEIVYTSSKARWPQIVGQHCWNLLGDVGSAEPPYLAKDSYPVIRRRNGFPEISPMWLQKMGFNSLSEAQDFCSTGYLDRDDQQDSVSGGFESSFHYYLANVFSAVESEKAGEKINIPSPIISTLVKWSLRELEQAESLNGKDFTDSESAHFALEHELNSQAEVEEFQALGASNAEDYERLKSAVSGDWESADEFRAATELSQHALRYFGQQQVNDGRGGGQMVTKQTMSLEDFALSSEDYNLWLEVQNEWPLPPYGVNGIVPGHSTPQQNLLIQQLGSSSGFSFNDLKGRFPDPTNQRSILWPGNQSAVQELMKWAAGSFIVNIGNFRILRKYSLDYLWQAKIVSEVINSDSIEIFQLIETKFEHYPPVGVRRGAPPPEIVWKNPEKSEHLKNTILDHPSRSQLVEFIYHNKIMREICSIDYDNRSIVRK